MNRWVAVMTALSLVFAFGTARADGKVSVTREENTRSHRDRGREVMDMRAAGATPLAVLTLALLMAITSSTG